MVDLTTDNQYPALLPPQCLHGEHEQTTESSVSGGTLLHTLPRNTLPLIFLCHILTSFADFWVFFQHDRSSPCQWPPAFQIIGPHLLNFVWCPLFYNGFNMFSSFWSCSPVNHKARRIPGKIQMRSRTKLSGRSEWLQMELKLHMRISGKAQSWEGCTLGFHEKCKHEASKDRQGTRYVFRVWLYQQEQA